MPGDKLTEDVIGDRFGVSRTIVRTALARLNAEGLVDLQPNKGPPLRSRACRKRTTSSKPACAWSVRS